MKHKAIAVQVKGGQPEVKVASHSGWFTICTCYLNPMTGDAMKTARKIARLLNQSTKRKP